MNSIYFDICINCTQEILWLEIKNIFKKFDHVYDNKIKNNIYKYLKNTTPQMNAMHAAVFTLYLNIALHVFRIYDLCFGYKSFFR